MALDGRAEVDGSYLCGVATGEGDTTAELRTPANFLVFALGKKLSRPANFYRIGGMKIFGDPICVIQRLMNA